MAVNELQNALQKCVDLMNPTIPNMTVRRGGLASEEIPNRPLTGTELKFRILRVCTDVTERLIPSVLFYSETPVRRLSDEFDRDQRFNFQTTFPGAEYTITGKFHFTAPGAPEPRVKWSLQVDFTFTTPHMPNMPVKARTPSPPLDLTDEESGVVAFRVTEKIANPNLVRVHTGLPIEVTAGQPPEHGEMFGKIEKHAVQYDAKDYPPLPEPVVVDISEETAAEWRVPRWKVEDSAPSIMCPACKGLGASWNNSAATPCETCHGDKMIPAWPKQASPLPAVIPAVKEAKSKTRYRHLDKEDLDAISEGGAGVIACRGS